MGYLPTGGGGGGVAIGDTITSATAGSAFFAGASGVMAQDNAGFFYDDANNQLKLTASAATQTPLQINLASAQTAAALEVKNSGGTVVASVTKDGCLTLPAGSSTSNARAINFPNVGIYQYSTTGLIFCVGSTLTQAAVGSNYSIVSDGQFQFGSGTNDPTVCDTGLARSAAGIVKITNGSTGAGALHMQEMTAPSAPSANNVYIYAEDNGSGKTRLMALFGSGVAQQLAIEP